MSKKDNSYTGLIISSLMLLFSCLVFAYAVASYLDKRREEKETRDLENEEEISIVDITTRSPVEDDSQDSKDQFPVYLPFAEAELETFDSKAMAIEAEEEPLTLDEEGILKFRTVSVDLPLYQKDYYYRKWDNAIAGVNELNLMPVLAPGDRIAVIANGYLTLEASKGYKRPPNGYYYGSGLCWATSALGQLMDQANLEFRAAYGMDLFVFRPGDRYPHEDYYQTYQYSNGGYGYSVVKRSSGGFDYRFTINPELKDNELTKDMKLKIIMTSTNAHPTAYNGESIGAYIISNIDF